MTGFARACNSGAGECPGGRMSGPRRASGKADAVRHGMIRGAAGREIRQMAGLWPASDMA